MLRFNWPVLNLEAWRGKIETRLHLFSSVCLDRGTTFQVALFLPCLYGINTARSYVTLLQNRAHDSSSLQRIVTTEREYEVLDSRLHTKLIGA